MDDKKMKVSELRANYIIDNINKAKEDLISEDPRRREFSKLYIDFIADFLCGGLINKCTEKLNRDREIIEDDYASGGILGRGDY